MSIGHLSSKNSAPLAAPSVRKPRLASRLAARAAVVAMALGAVDAAAQTTKEPAPTQPPAAARASDKPAPAAPAEAGDTSAPTAPAKAGEKPAVTISIAYLKQKRDQSPPLSLLDIAPADDGVAGAKLGISDNNTTGRFVGQAFKLETFEDADVDALVKTANEQVAAGTSYFVADLDAEALIKLADALAGKPALILNVGNPDDSVREEQCRANVMHTFAEPLDAGRRARLSISRGSSGATGSWSSGPQPDDKLLAEAYKRAAKRFGAKIVEQREFKYDAGSRRADGGFEQIQQQIPQFTQNAADHDVLIVADEGQIFGRLLPLSRLDAAARRRHQRGLYADELAPRCRALGRHAVSEPVQAASQPAPCGRLITTLGWRCASSARRRRARAAPISRRSSHTFARRSSRSPPSRASEDDLSHLERPAAPAL